MSQIAIFLVNVAELEVERCSNIRFYPLMYTHTHTHTERERERARDDHGAGPASTGNTSMAAAT